jgi:DNA-binding NarL/FixJ family response regulator
MTFCKHPDGLWLQRTDPLFWHAVDAEVRVARPAVPAMPNCEGEMSTQRKHNGHETHRILLIESDQRDAERVAHALRYNSHYPEIKRVESAPELAEALETFDPDVVLSGSAAGLSAREALDMSREKHPEAPFVLLPESVDRSVVDSIRAGAADFVSKTELDRLPSAVDTALAQRAPLRKLSRRQREVFRMLASGVTMRDIATRLGLSRKTVETHRAQVMARLGARHVPELVRLAIRLGIVSSEE